jgi:alkanesulfonate monooxygenase SsuD/methylene tetrahydromethanopterin reductase-like flavin-dependent oxidoreductase (luciferase family)
MRWRHVGGFAHTGLLLRVKRRTALDLVTTERQEPSMEFGWYVEFHRQVPAQPDVDAFAQGLAQVEDAERWGLDSVWLAEIHQQAARSVLSVPMTVAAAIAARTSRIRIGTGVQVLPLCHPLRLAEESATVDQISRGRLLMGVGRSGNPRAYAAYGVPYAESRERFYEVLEILKRAWTQERFSYDGKYYHFDNVCVTPKPYQAPYPELRIAANSPDTFESCGTQGVPIFVATRLGNLNELVPNLRVYRENWVKAGHPGNGEVFLRVPVYVAATEAQALSEPEESIMYFYRYLGARIEESATLEGARAIENRAERGQRLQQITWDEVIRSKVIVGTPAMVADRLAQLQQELGLSGILAELNCGMRISPQRVMNSLRMMCEDVIPHFRR